MSHPFIAQFVWWFLVALTPHERFSAMKRLDSGRDVPTFVLNKWFIMVGWSLIALLVLILIAIQRHQAELKRQHSLKRYNQFCDDCELTVEERDVLELIVQRGRLSDKSQIFSMPDAFESAQTQLMKECYASGKGVTERKKLSVLIHAVQVKLGFVADVTRGGLHNRPAKKQSSRQIDVGKTVKIVPLNHPDVAEIEAQVIENTETEFILRPEISIVCHAGEVWKVQYLTGALMWEFEAITMACGLSGLVLNHCERVHFINRRRFPRADIQRVGKVCKFDVSCRIQAEQSLVPVFVDAQIIEVSGPGLRILADLDVKIKDRILIIFEFEDNQVIQDVAEVRGVRETPTGRSIGIELVGLSDKAIGELVHVTNEQAARQKRQAEQALQDTLNDTEKPTHETAEVEA